MPRRPSLDDYDAMPAQARNRPQSGEAFREYHLPPAAREGTMSPVGGSRHYDGGGLGPEAGWGCPSCGADNQGPIAQGCTACGAGRPGRHIGTPGPPPPPTTRPDPPEPRPRDQATVWAETHPEATIEESYRAGYLDGVRRAREAAAAAPTEPVAFTAAHIINRTMVAALELFRDQVLIADPEETTTGEWLTAPQTSALIQQIKTYIAEGEPVHA